MEDYYTIKQGARCNIGQAFEHREANALEKEAFVGHHDGSPGELRRNISIVKRIDEVHRIQGYPHSNMTV